MDGCHLCRRHPCRRGKLEVMARTPLALPRMLSAWCDCVAVGGEAGAGAGSPQHIVSGVSTKPQAKWTIWCVFESLVFVIVFLLLSVWDVVLRSLLLTTINSHTGPGHPRGQQSERVGPLRRPSLGAVGSKWCPRDCRPPTASWTAAAAWVSRAQEAGEPKCVCVMVSVICAPDRAASALCARIQYQIYDSCDRKTLCCLWHSRKWPFVSCKTESLFNSQQQSLKNQLISFYFNLCLTKQLPCEECASVLSVLVSEFTENVESLPFFP